MLKGGILLGAYGVRRPTKDADSNAVGGEVSPEHLAEVMRDAATVKSDDGVEFDLDTLTVQAIRAPLPKRGKGATGYALQVSGKSVERDDCRMVRANLCGKIEKVLP